MTQWRDADGKPLPEKLSLKPSRLKWTMVMLICLAFALGALFLIKPETDNDATMRWLTIGFFGVGVLVSIPGMMGVGGLDLDRQGFTIRSLGRSSRLEWRECSVFEVVQMPRGGTFVGFSSATDQAHALADIARTYVGTTGVLPDKYGMKVQALADLMNEFRSRALGLSDSL